MTKLQRQKKKKFLSDINILEENSLGQKQTWFQNGLSEPFLTYKTRQGEALLSSHRKNLTLEADFWFIWFIFSFSHWEFKP